MVSQCYYFSLILNYSVRSLYSHTNSYNNAVTQCHVDFAQRAWAACADSSCLWDCCKVEPLGNKIKLMPRPDWSLWGIIPGFFFLSWRKNLLMNARTDMSKFQDGGFSEYGVLFFTHIMPTILLLLSSQRILVNLWFKARPNDSNTSTQHIATLLAQHLEAPTKRSQHVNATARKIVGRNMLHAFGNSVATCCDMLSILKMELVRMPRINVVARRLQHHATSTNAAWKIDQFQIWANSTQHVATRRNRVAKRVQHVAPYNVAIYCAQLLRSFDRSSQMLGQQCWEILCWNVAIIWPMRRTMAVHVRYNSWHISLKSSANNNLNWPISTLRLVLTNT